MFHRSRPNVAVLVVSGFCLLGALGVFPSVGSAQGSFEPAQGVPPEFGAAQQDPPNDAIPVVRIDGRGHGHGVGLSQWGAHTMAEEGASAATILSTFYPGTHLGSASGEVAVRVDDRSAVRVAFPSGGEIRSGRDGSGTATGFPVEVPAGSIVTVQRASDGYRVTGAIVGASGSRVMAGGQLDCLIPVLCPTTTTTTTAPADTVPGDATPGGPDASAPPASQDPVWAIPHGGGTVTSVDRGRTYRGVLEISGDLDVVNHVDVESYLRGMIEVPGHWPAAAVQAQTIAARTFALRAMATAGSICDTDACQVYFGVARESAGLDAAVATTTGTVVRYGTGLAATFFSASAGGISATPLEGFGNESDVPYLQAVEHPDADPQPWTVQFTPDDLGRRLGYPGTASEVRIDMTGPSGRAISMTIDGDAGPIPIDPQDFRSTLDLRSTLFTVKMAMSDGSEIAVAEDTPRSSVQVEPKPGVQAPIAAEPIIFAVEPSSSQSIPWQWPTAAAASIAIVAVGTSIGFSRHGLSRKVSTAGRSGRVSLWRSLRS